MEKETGLFSTLFKGQRKWFTIFAFLWIMALIDGSADAVGGAALLTFFMLPILLIGPMFLASLSNNRDT